MNIFINEILGFDWRPSKEEFNENLTCLLNSIRIFGMLHDCNIYFDGRGISNFFEELEIIDDCNEYSLFDLRHALRITITETDAQDWTQSKVQKDNHNYYAILFSGSHGVLVNNSSLAEAAEYTHQKIGINMILNILKSNYNTHDIVNINRTSINPPSDMSLIRIPAKCKKEDLIPFYFTNRRKISYSHHNKHIENYTLEKGSKNGTISPLECSIAEAERLLVKNAIFENSSCKDLIAYDRKRNKYIRFKCENPTDDEKVYHGFHPHDQKFDRRMVQFIEKNLDLFG